MLIGLKRYIVRILTGIRLPFGFVLFKGPFSYNKDLLTTRVNCDFCNDPHFRESYKLGAKTLSIFDTKKASLFLYGEWRVYICCWAAERAKELEGDFVECGVNSGFLSRAAMNYIDFKSMNDRKFYLFDTYCGIPEEQISASEKKLGIVESNIKLYSHDIYDDVKDTFKDFDNAVLIKGIVPDTLPQAKTDRVCYLSIDMNCVIPEVAALEYFWDKLVPGALVILDDYGFSAGNSGYINQKLAIDAFASRRGTSVLSLPTGQGLMIKA